MWVPLLIQLAPVLVGALAPLVTAAAQRIAPQAEPPSPTVVWLVGSGMAGATAAVTGGDPTLALVGGATIAGIVERMKGGQ